MRPVESLVVYLVVVGLACSPVCASAIELPTVTGEATDSTAEESDLPPGCSGSPASVRLHVTTQLGALQIDAIKALELCLASH